MAYLEVGVIFFLKLQTIRHTLCFDWMFEALFNWFLYYVLIFYCYTSVPGKGDRYTKKQMWRDWTCLKAPYSIIQNMDSGVTVQHKGLVNACQSNVPPFWRHFQILLFHWWVLKEPAINLYLTCIQLIALSGTSVNANY